MYIATSFLIPNWNQTSFIVTQANFILQACQPPADVCRYFGREGAAECHACYHFPLMPGTDLFLLGSSWLNEDPNLRRNAVIIIWGRASSYPSAMFKALLREDASFIQVLEGSHFII